MMLEASQMLPINLSPALQLKNPSLPTAAVASFNSVKFPMDQCIFPYED
jgi:hypothetical protein